MRDSFLSFRDWSKKEQSLAGGLQVILLIPILLVILGWLFSYTVQSYGKSQVESTLSQSVVFASQFNHRGTAVPQPNCQLGAVIASYNVSRDSIRNIAHIKSEAQFSKYYPAAKRRPGQFSSEGPSYTFSDTTINNAQSKVGLGTDRQAKACTLPDSEPLRGLSAFNEEGSMFSPEHGIQIDQAGNIKSTKSLFYVNGANYYSAVYEKDGSVRTPAHSKVCVTELVPNYFWGFIKSDWAFQPVSICAEASLRLKKE